MLPAPHPAPPTGGPRPEAQLDAQLDGLLDGLLAAAPSQEPELSTRALALTRRLVLGGSRDPRVWACRARLLCAPPLQPLPAGTSAGPAPAGPHTDDQASSVPGTAPDPQSCLAAELDLLALLCTQHPDSPLVWQHRRLVVSHVRPPAPPAKGSMASACASAPASPWRESATEDLALNACVLQDHDMCQPAWAYRQWSLLHFDRARGKAPPPRVYASVDPTAAPQDCHASALWAEERTTMNAFARHRLFNPYVWEHRYFILCHECNDTGAGDGGGGGGGAEDSLIRLVREVSFTKNKIAVTMDNPLCWRYLRRVFTLLESRCAHDTCSLTRLGPTAPTSLTSYTASKISPGSALQPPHCMVNHVRDQLDTFAASLSPSEEDLVLSPDADLGGYGVLAALEWLLDSLTARLHLTRDFASTRPAASSTFATEDGTIEPTTGTTADSSTVAAARSTEGRADGAGGSVDGSAHLPSLSPGTAATYTARALRLLDRLTVADPARTPEWQSRRSLLLAASA